MSVAESARATYCTAKGIPDGQPLAWTDPDPKRCLPQEHRMAWSEVVLGIRLRGVLRLGVAKLAERAWLDYLNALGLLEVGVRWEDASAVHRDAWRAVVCNVLGISVAAAPR